MNNEKCTEWFINKYGPKPMKRIGTDHYLNDWIDRHDVAQAAWQAATDHLAKPIKLQGMMIACPSED